MQIEALIDLDLAVLVSAMVSSASGAFSVNQGRLAVQCFFCLHIFCSYM